MMKNRYKLTQRVLTVLIVIFGIITVVRSFFSIDLTDESYAIAETLLVLKGNVPYAYAATDGIGMTFYMIPFAYLYKSFVPSLSGIVLYMRLCFSILRLMLVFVVYKLLIKKHSKIPVLLSCLILVVWYYFSNYFSYNSNGIWSLIIVSVWLYILYDCEITNINVAKLFAAGVIAAMAVFSHPLAVIAIPVYLVLLLGLSPIGTKIKRVTFFCFGGGLQSFFVLACIVAQTGLGDFLNGIRNLMNSVKTLGDYGRSAALILYFQTYKNMFTVCLMLFLFSLIATKVITKRIHYKVAISVVMLLGSILSLLFAIGKGFDLIYVGGYIGSLVIFMNILWSFFKRNEIHYCILSLPFVLFVIMEFITQRNYSVVMHPSLAVPAMIPVILALSEKDNCCKVISGIATLIFSVILIVSDVIFVYRDAPISELTTCVEEGVYKGIRTNSLRAEGLQELERFIDSITEDDKRVMFRDCVPFANLMYKGAICDICAWDALNYKQGWKLDRVMYNYFLITDTYPNEIVYIDFGRDNNLSIEDDTFRFNNWVNSYYSFTDEIELNDVFRIKVYDYNGLFDGNYSKWTDFEKL